MSSADHTQPDPQSAAQLLAVAAEELGALRAQAEQTAARIATSAPQPGSLPPQDALLADLAGSLVSRSHAMAVECRRLSELMDRVAGLYAAPGSDPVPGGPGDDQTAAPPRNEADPAPQTAEVPQPAPAPAPPVSEQVAVGQEGAEGSSGAPEATAAADSGPVEVSEGVKLLVTQMAVSGAGRQEIERRLVSDFGIARPAEVLDQLFGSR